MARPNILFICTDQQSANMMSCAGNRWVNTPAMDSLATDGMRFERAYCTNPVCAPSRFSLMTGRMPSAIGMRSNEAGHIAAVPEAIRERGLGWVLRDAGYETAYGGKVHLPKMGPPDLGFEVITRNERDGLSDACAEYLRAPRDKPFLLVASFINPHDICYMAIRDFAGTEQAKRLVERGTTELARLDRALELPPGVNEAEFFEKHCPPAPPNFEPQEDEPEAIRLLLAQRPFKQNAREKWPEERWRLHRWAYARLTEMVDRQIARVLEALRDSGQARNTVVVFTSDHGDMDAAHRMEHKTALYEAPCRVPLIVCQPGVTPPGAVDRTHLVSNGLDLLPTLCDYAGVAPPPDLEGASFRALAEGCEPDQWRSSLPIESEIGRAVVTQRHKYILYDEGASREQLMDLEADPFETRNAAQDPENQAVLAECRELARGVHPF